ncbi:MAG: CpsB/CapC family capsule biosynthesis tyrosine phosphatase, partial [bacterium]
MTDLHCHILPGIDDGAQDVNISLAMLRMEAEQGVGTVCLTPHFYRDQERPSSFFRRRQHALDTLLEALPEDMDTRLILASEVAWVQNIAEWPELPQFCYGGTNYILIEPPFTAWSSAFITSLYEIMDRRGLIPVIAHIERYLDRRNTSALSELYSMNLPIQLSATQFIRRF